MACTVRNACRRDVAANRSRTGHSARVACAHPGRPSAESGRMKQFIHDMLTGRIIFGAGSVAQLSDAIARIGAKRPFLLSIPGQLDQDASVTFLANILPGHFAGAPLTISEKPRLGHTVLLSV